MKYSLKQIVEDVTDVITNNSINIQSVEQIELFDANMDKSKDFPKVYLITDEDGSFDENINSANVRFLFLDVQRGRLSQAKRDLEIKSDMMLEASMLFDRIQSKGYSIVFPISYTPISGEFNDGLAGVDCTVTFNLSKPCYEV
jgi:hypothetical protein